MQSRDKLAGMAASDSELMGAVLDPGVFSISAFANLKKIAGSR
jgi:hypothetical protein